MQKAVTLPRDPGSRHSLSYLKLPVDGDKWSRCEKGEDRACYCTRRLLILANAFLLVPLSESRPEDFERLLLVYLMWDGQALNADLNRQICAQPSTQSGNKSRAEPDKSSRRASGVRHETHADQVTHQLSQLSMVD
jgi:hypothetical protein